MNGVTVENSPDQVLFEFDKSNVFIEDVTVLKESTVDGQQSIFTFEDSIFEMRRVTV